MFDINDYDSYDALKKGLYSFSIRARKELAQKLFFRLVAADVAGRKEQQHYLDGASLKLAAATPQFMEALREFLGKVTVTSAQLASLEGKYRRFVFGTKTLMGVDDSIQYVILERARNQIAEAIRGEETFYDFKTNMQDEFGKDLLPEARLKLIFHQNIIQAYNAGAWDQLYNQMEEDVDLVYDTAHDERVGRDKNDPCGFYDDFVAPKSDPVWETLWPPIHFNCRCTVRVALRADKKTAKDSVDLKYIPEEFRSWPGDGFALSAPTADQLDEMQGYFQ